LIQTGVVMKKFWETYTKNDLMLAESGKPHSKAYLIISFATFFILYIGNIVLSLYVIDPKYYFDDERFLSFGSIFIITWIVTELAYWQYCKNWQRKNQA
jgi:hypothetical protein